MDAARRVGQDAPTLCEGWTARDLVGHLLVLRDDPLAWPGIAIPALASLTDRRMARATAAGYDAALDSLAGRRPWLPPVIDLPGSRWGHHLGEYVVHTEDLLRANALSACAPDAATAEVLWSRVQVAARQLHGRRQQGLVLVRADTGESAQVVPGERAPTVTGTVLELLVWTYRGAEHADIVVDAG
ncbi:maleylpyruvate isomerase family mycothiol-dependent enzyme [Propioniciclava sp.]|uniref:maleylpyruvate isomerase family mycothiol-dependent enzyme n=1 Tax=Propioniciclava sp. TaxID=2038686 RepID=UPI0039E280ED